MTTIGAAAVAVAGRKRPFGRSLERICEWTAVDADGIRLDWTSADALEKGIPAAQDAESSAADRAQLMAVGFVAS